MKMFDRINLCVDIYVYIELKVPHFDAANWVNLRNASLPVSSSASKLFSSRKLWIKFFFLNNKIHFFFTCAFSYRSICLRGKLSKITAFAYLQLNNKQTNELSRYRDRAKIRS